MQDSFLKNSSQKQLELQLENKSSSVVGVKFYYIFNKIFFYFNVYLFRVILNL